jgi:hypothetical protein
MAKRRYSFDESKLEKFLKEGRGKGHGADYRPWLTIQDVSSIGLSSRILGCKTGRDHHLLSKGETGLFLLLDWSDSVTDIREQYPLDREETRRIASEIGVRHPVDAISKTDIVMTTDFLVDVQSDSGNKLFARSVKIAADLDDARTLEKQEIENRFWKMKGVDWGIVTDKELPVQRIKNLQWLHELYSLKDMTEPHPGYWDTRCVRFLACLPQADSMSVKQFARLLEDTQGFAVGEALKILRHLAANKRINIDLDVKFDMRSSMNSFSAIAPHAAHQTNRKTA